MAKSELQEFIRAVPLFAGLLPSEVDRITMVMNPIDVAAGEVVCTEGEPGHEFYVIASGEAAVEHAGGVANKLHTGDHFGELALLDRGPRSATVRALSDCRLYVLQDASFAARPQRGAGAGAEAARLARPPPPPGRVATGPRRRHPLSVLTFTAAASRASR